jgi:hypothetical protein
MLVILNRSGHGMAESEKVFNELVKEKKGVAGTRQADGTFRIAREFEPNTETVVFPQLYGG